MEKFVFFKHPKTSLFVGYRDYFYMNTLGALGNFISKHPLFFPVTQYFKECYTICYADLWDAIIYYVNIIPLINLVQA